MNDEKQTVIATKLSLKTIGAQPKRGELTEENPGPIVLATLIGRVTGYKVGSGDKGEFYAFNGSFEGTNVRTGESARSSKCFVPNALNGLLAEAVDAANGQAIDFALQIGAKFTNTPIGYEYVIVPLVAVQESDELSALRELAENKIKALAGPEKKK